MTGQMQGRAERDAGRLERGYRRVLAWYPRSFRADSEEEILAVLLATAAEGQVRVGLAEARDLVRGAVRMRLWPARPRPRAVRVAVTLMLAGAAAEVAAVITIIATMGTVRAAVAGRYPAAVHGAMVNLTIDVALTPVAIGLWLWLAWANGKGRDWARMVSLACFGLITLSVMGALAQQSGTFAPADLMAGAVEWVIGLASVVLIFTPKASQYYEPEPIQQ